MNTPDYPLPFNGGHTHREDLPPVTVSGETRIAIVDRLTDIEIRLQAIEKQLARLVPLIEIAERYLSMTPLERVRATLKSGI